MDNKDIQGKMLETLKAIHKICGEEGISYMLTQGTLLGAVREKGFIEWDVEDSDIMMYRRDFDAFAEYWGRHKDELGFQLLMDEMGLVPRLATKENPEIFVEVILIDHLPENKLLGRFNRMILRLLYGMLCKRGPDYEYKIKDRAKDLIKWVLNLVFIGKSKQRLYKKISRAGNKKTSDVVFFSNEIPRRMFVGFKEELFLETISIPFEDTELNVPKEWDAVLKFYYGDGYMTPKRTDYYVS
jgi:lipopolysaccharide cholinephosphotransferase